MVKKLGKRTRLLFGVAIGALLMYLFDPDRGDARRTRLREQVRPTRREDELGSDGRSGTMRGVTPPASGSPLDVETPVTPRPLAG
jgi:hypothetical protein